MLIKCVCTHYVGCVHLLQLPVPIALAQVFSRYSGLAANRVLAVGSVQKIESRDSATRRSKVLCGVTVWFEQQFLNDFCPGGLHDLSPEESCRWFAADVYPSSALLHSYRFFRHTGIRPQIRAALLRLPLSLAQAEQLRSKIQGRGLSAD